MLLCLNLRLVEGIASAAQVILGAFRAPLFRERINDLDMLCVDVAHD